MNIKNRNLKVYLIAGEPSGDVLGARLIRALRKKTDNNIEFFGLGSEAMEKEGLTSLFNVSDLAIMGLIEVIPHIPKVLRRIRETVLDIEEKKPDIVIGIDSWSFCARVYKRLKKLNLGIPQVHYVAPQVWAWKKNRVKTMNKYIDHLLTLFPEEAKFFTPYGLDTTFVGHPVIESGIYSGNAENFRKKFNISAEKEIIAMLPGSRHNEVQRLLPVFIEVGLELLKKNHNFLFVIPTVQTVSKRVKEMLSDSKFPALVIEDIEDRHNAFIASAGAIAASGTVALELAIAGVPHLVGYRVAPLTYAIGIRVVNIKFMNLSNLLLDREVVPEFMQHKCTKENLSSTLLKLLEKKDLYKKQMSGIEEVKKILGVGKQTPSENASDVILSLIK